MSDSGRLDRAYVWPEAEGANPWCRRCGAVIHASLVAEHLTWHDHLLYVANTLGLPAGLLDYTSQL